MKLVSFDPLRSIDIPGVHPLKTGDIWEPRDKMILEADWVLFPKYWQVNTLVYALHKKIFPSVNSYHLGLNKVEMTRALQAVCPENVPDTLILPPDKNAADKILEHFCFPFVAKVIKSSMGLGVYLINNSEELEKYICANDTIYVQEFLPIKRDIRVVYIGERVITAYWRSAAEGAFHNNVARGGTVSFEDIPEAALRLVEKLAAHLGINHAGFDIAEVGGHFFFLEFNIKFGNQALNEKGISPGKIILKYLQEKSCLKSL